MADQELNNKINELQRFHDLTVDREIFMIELKNEVNELLKESGKPEKYRIAGAFPSSPADEKTHDPQQTHLATLNLLEDLHREIQARKDNEEELKRSQESLADIFQTVSEGIAYISPQGRILSVNASFEKIAGVSRENLVGKNILKLTRELMAPELVGGINDIIKNIINRKVDEVFRLENNNRVLEISSTINRNSKHFTGVVRDITERVRSEAALRLSESRLIQAERLSALGEMSAGMAHEINQPLNTLSIVLDNILLEAKQEHMVSEEYILSKSEKIFNNILRIKNIIDHVRDFSRKQESTFLSQFWINKSITDTLSMVSEQFKMSEIEMVTALNDDLPMIEGNNYKFEQVILNLLINSKDALLEKRSRLAEPYPMSIHIRTTFNQVNILVEVEDNGCGIGKKHMDKVLQPFYTTKETGKGTGLGLSISYGLIHELNGRIDISSKVMSGTIISITLPIKTKKI
jgi:PAS domain S-box-containing protein